MATHGKARTSTIRALGNRKSFDRSGSHGFSMRAIEGKVSHQGYMPWDEWVKYRDAEVTYTVISYSTVIAWVQSDGTVVIPDVRYSVTTSHHQSLCKVYL